MAEPGQLIRSLTGRPAARNFHSFVINELGMGVASGAFPVGSTLPGDAEMIARYDVSRTVLREAVKTLEAKGLVEARAKVGTRVLARNRWNLFDRQVLFWIFHATPEPGFAEGLFEVRSGLEMQAVALAATRAHAEQMRMMRYWLAQAQISSGMVENHGLAIFEIHRLVAEASQNPVLRSATGLVEFALAMALRAQMARGESDFASLKAPHYEALLAAIEAGRAEEAGQAMAQVLRCDRDLAL